MLPDQYSNAAESFQIQLDGLEPGISTDYMETGTSSSLADVASIKSQAEQLASYCAAEPNANGIYTSPLSQLNNVSVRASGILTSYGYYAQNPGVESQQYAHDIPFLAPFLGYDSKPKDPDPSKTGSGLSSDIFSTMLLLAFAFLVLGRH